MRYRRRLVEEDGESVRLWILKKTPKISGEVPLLELQAAVYNYDTNLKTWVAKDAGASRIWIFHNQTTSAYRVIGQSVADKQVRLEWTRLFCLSSAQQS